MNGTGVKTSAPPPATKDPTLDEINDIMLNGTGVKTSRKAEPSRVNWEDRTVFEF